MTEPDHAYPAVSFTNLPATTISKVFLQTTQGLVGVDLGSGVREVVHVCDTPDPDRFDGLEWTCPAPDCRQVWEIHTESWWEAR